MIAFDEPKKRHARIEIIPMIDVMMFLLVFFVLISLNVIPSQGLNTDLPQSKTAARQVADHPIVVTIGPEGQLQVAGQDVDISALGKAVQLAAAQQGVDQSEGKGPRVVLKTDKATPMQKVIDVLDALRDAKIERFTFTTKSQG